MIKLLDMIINLYACKNLWYFNFVLFISQFHKNALWWITLNFNFSTWFIWKKYKKKIQKWQIFNLIYWRYLVQWSVALTVWCVGNTWSSSWWNGEELTGLEAVVLNLNWLFEDLLICAMVWQVVSIRRQKNSFIYLKLYVVLYDCIDKIRWILVRIII